MIHWDHATSRFQCGAELDCFIAPGELYVASVGPTYRKIRCVRHSPWPVPADLPATFEAQQARKEASTWRPLRAVAQGFDPKRKAANDGE
jgi:hypothetical protein